MLYDMVTLLNDDGESRSGTGDDVYNSLVYVHDVLDVQ